jgi:hypothetical protein
MSHARITKSKNFRLSIITVNRQRVATVQDREQQEWDRLKALNQRLSADAKPVARI